MNEYDKRAERGGIIVFSYGGVLLCGFSLRALRLCVNNPCTKSHLRKAAKAQRFAKPNQDTNLSYKIARLHPSKC